MSNEFDDATQLGSIGHNPRVPAQPATPAQRPHTAFPAPSLPHLPQDDEDLEGTVLSTHNVKNPVATKPVAPSTGNARQQFTPAVPTRQTVQQSPSLRSCPSPRRFRHSRRPR